jgi:hypothetical protein
MESNATGRVEQEVKARFPEGAVQEVRLLRYGDDPAIEPGGAGIRVVIDPARVPEDGEKVLKAFHQAHEEAIRQLARDLPELLPEAKRLEFTAGGHSLFLISLGEAGERPPDLTPVMARLGPADLETLDTLIGAGIAPTRAEAVRWALARIRERPAYEKLRERGREIEELKAQF